jgi:hypothetical protein
MQNEIKASASITAAIIVQGLGRLGSRLRSVGFVAMQPDPMTLGKPTMWTLATLIPSCFLLTDPATSGVAGETNPEVGSNWG